MSHLATGPPRGVRQKSAGAGSTRGTRRRFGAIESPSYTSEICIPRKLFRSPSDLLADSCPGQIQDSFGVFPGAPDAAIPVPIRKRAATASRPTPVSIGRGCTPLPARQEQTSIRALLHDTRGNVSRCAGPIEVNPDKVAAAHREEGQQVSPAEVAAIDHIAGALGTKEQ